MTEKTKPYWQTAVSEVTSSDVYVRGYSLGELIGRVPFSAALFLLIRARLPSPGETRMIEAVLCSVLDYSLRKPGTIAARYCVSGNPSMVAGIATAALAVGEYTLAPDEAGGFIAASLAEHRALGGAVPEDAARLVTRLHEQRRRIPGFGHPQFRFTDPRAQKLKSIAQTEQVWGAACEWYEAVHAAYTRAVSKPEMVINEVGMMAAILADMGFTPPEMTGIAIISSLPGVVAHISEELQSKVRIRIIPQESVEQPDLRLDLGAGLQSAGWDA
jgi:citryl-CoA lyase